jgi:hypothetical protein
MLNTEHRGWQTLDSTIAVITLQAALEAFYGLGYIVGPMIGGMLFSVRATVLMSNSNVL